MNNIEIILEKRQDSSKVYPKIEVYPEDNPRYFPTEGALVSKQTSLPMRAIYAIVREYIRKDDITSEVKTTETRTDAVLGFTIKTRDIGVVPVSRKVKALQEALEAL